MAQMTDEEADYWDKHLIIAMTDELLRLTEDLDDYAANLRALDHARHNGVGLKRQGFIEAALRRKHLRSA